ncbi:MAG: SDR family oxidoreductase [Micrococcus sp.]|nr:SDR family oxidoreductase [Micrococcus sp.]
MAKYLIIGGHGKVALRTAPLLAQDGHEVTSVIRNPDHAADVEAAGATPLVLDVETASQDELAQAFAGQDAIIWSAGAGGGNPERTYAVDRDAAIRSMDAAEQAGVKRYLMVSYLGARPAHGVPEDDSFHPYATAKAAADDHLRTSSLDWTILGPGALTTEDPSGRIRLATAATVGELRDTSRGNVAEAIRAALASGNSIGKQYEFVDGEEPVAAVFARA